MGLYCSAREAFLAIPTWGHHRPSWANCSTQSKAFENNYTLFHTTQRRSTLKLVSTSVSTALLRQPPSISRELSLELLIRPAQQEEVDGFYTSLGATALEAGVAVSVVSIEGASCRLENAVADRPARDRGQYHGAVASHRPRRGFAAAAPPRGRKHPPPSRSIHRPASCVSGERAWPARRAPAPHSPSPVHPDPDMEFHKLHLYTPFAAFATAAPPRGREHPPPSRPIHRPASCVSGERAWPARRAPAPQSPSPLIIPTRPGIQERLFCRKQRSSCEAGRAGGRAGGRADGRSAGRSGGRSM